MNNTVLVIGDCVAGMRAAVELLLQGFRVCLLGAEPSLGRRAMQADRDFPAGECAACSLQPLIVELVNNPNATILVSAGFLSLQGEPGEFTAEVTGKPAGSAGDSVRVTLDVGAVIVAARETGLAPCAGVFLCGPASATDEIGPSVVQACAAASRAAALLAPTGGRGLTPSSAGDLLPVKAADDPKIAVVIESGDAELADLLDLEALRGYTLELAGVERVEVTPCASDGAKIRELIATGDFNRMVVAGPSPVPHEPLFQRHVEQAGLNRYLLEMVNLHDQCARVHSSDRAAATQKAKILMKMGIARTRRLEPLDDLQVDINQACLVVGGSAGGVACAARLAEMGFRVHLVEEAPDPGRIPGNDHPLVRPLLAGFDGDDNVTVHAPATVKSVRGCVGDFKVDLAREGRQLTLAAGAIVVATATGVERGGSFEESLALERDHDGFYLSTQGILNLLDFSTEAIFNCGPARAELALEDQVVEGEAAASRAACFLAAPVMSKPPVISRVVDENCDGCAYCVDPCPTRTITLLEFMRRGEIKKVVQVNEATCIGCGICMSTCPKQGILVMHFKPEHFLEMVKGATDDNDNQPVIVCFCCNRCAYPGADEAGQKKIQYPPNVLIIRSVCSGMIHPNIIMDALSQMGADGVLLCGCHPGNCRSRAGIVKAQARAESIELLLEDFGLEQERFRLEFIAASEGAKFAQVVSEMTEELSALGPNPYK
jgi:heterodisulfide reductase subunit A-like polyferredoxin/coenzyme F420-reducing hydrogenase delta subunit